MKGWQIFVHSLRLVLRNLDQAFRVSAVLYLVQVANQVAIFLNPPPPVTGDNPMMMATPTVESLVLSVLSIIASLWIAVAWHRYVLASEEPQGWLPRWHGPEMLGYLGRSVMIGILVVLGILAAALPVGLLTAALPGLAGLMGLGLVGLGGYLFFRMGVMLPSIAMGQKMRLGEAWNATRDPDGAIIVLALVVIGGSILVQLPSWLHSDPGSVINLVYTIVTGWFVTIIGISILTTLYGHYVEGRPID